MGPQIDADTMAKKRGRPLEPRSGLPSGANFPLTPLVALIKP